MKLGLQIALGVFSLIPLAFALLGLATGAGLHMPAGGYPGALDNQYRYTSGTYVLVTLLLWWVIPSIERHGRLLALICVALVVGAAGRAMSLAAVGPGTPEQMVGMVIEFASPLFLIWHAAVAARSRAV